MVQKRGHFLEQCLGVGRTAWDLTAILKLSTAAGGSYACPGSRTTVAQSLEPSEILSCDVFYPIR